MIYRVLLVLALAAAGILSFFYLWQVAEGPHYGIGTFTLVTLVAWGLIAAAVALRNKGNTVLACLLLLPVAFPATMYGLFILIFVLSGESWR